MTSLKKITPSPFFKIMKDNVAGRGKEEIKQGKCVEE
jgi:hypothetical protein